jgi:hypothetical protein
MRDKGLAMKESNNAIQKANNLKIQSHKNLPVLSSPSAQTQPLEGESKNSAKSNAFRVE